MSTAQIPSVGRVVHFVSAVKDVGQGRPGGQRGHAAAGDEPRGPHHRGRAPAGGSDQVGAQGGGEEPEGIAGGVRRDEGEVPAERRVRRGGDGARHLALARAAADRSAAGLSSGRSLTGRPPHGSRGGRPPPPQPHRMIPAVVQTTKASVVDTEGGTGLPGRNAPHPPVRQGDEPGHVPPHGRALSCPVRSRAEAAGPTLSLIHGHRCWRAGGRRLTPGTRAGRLLSVRTVCGVPQRDQAGVLACAAVRTRAGHQQPDAVVQHITAGVIYQRVRGGHTESVRSPTDRRRTSGRGLLRGA